jgi:hypothetical protein
MTDDLPRDLEALVGTLRTPVPMTPAMKARVLAAAHRHGVPRRPHGRFAVVLAAGAGIAAIVAAIALRPHVGVTDAEGLVPFVLKAPHAARVTIVGDFNDWDPTATPMHRAGDNAWWAVVRLPAGRYHYAFVVDGTRWVADPSAPHDADTDFGRASSVVTILGDRT